MEAAQRTWGFFGFGGGIVAVAREPELWRARVGNREAAGRLLDEALEELLGRRHAEIGALTVRILDWELNSRSESDPPVDDVPRARRQREVELLRRLLAQEEAKRAPNPLVVRAARDLLGERGQLDLASADGDEVCG